MVLISLASIAILAAGFAVGYAASVALERLFRKTGAGGRLGPALAGFPAAALYLLAMYASLRSFAAAAPGVYQLVAPLAAAFEESAPALALIVMLNIVIAALALTYGRLEDRGQRASGKKHP